MVFTRLAFAATIALFSYNLLAGATPQVTEASAEATAPGNYHLRWNNAVRGAPVDVFVADKPDAPRNALHLLVRKNRNGEVALSPTLKSRPYFYLAAENGTGVWTAERVLPLQGGRNFRDLGGYATSAGQRVKWGKLYRSGSMAALTATDYDYLSNLGIRVVCDLRTTAERNAEPNKWQEVAKLTYWTRDYATSFGELRKLMAAGLPTAEQAKAAMIAGYRELPFEQAPSYRQVFKRLAAGEVPLAFNCSAGKDRAGTAAALILSALGVPLTTVVEDYTLTDKIDNFRLGLSNSGTLSRLPSEVVNAILRADPDYIRAGLAAVEDKRGSIAAYLREDLGISADELAAIRTQLLE